MLAANVSFSKGEKRGKEEEEEEKGGDFTGASLRIADTQGCHNLAEKKLEILYTYVYAGTKHIVFNILHQKFQTCTSLFAISFKISHEILE